MNLRSTFSLLILLPVLFSLTCFNLGCRTDDPAPGKMDYPGIVFRDEYGNHIGTYGGKDDNDWKYDPAWTPEIYNLMNFNDSTDLSGTYLDSTYIPGNDPPVIQVIFFPNPVANMASVYIILPGRIKVKLSMVDAYFDTVLTKSYIDIDTSWVWLNLEDPSQFVEGEVYRLFYTFSAVGNIDFYKGHGDILMCGDRPPQYQNTCLRFIE